MSETSLDQVTHAAILGCVRTVEDLEVLLHLARHRDRYASADSVSAATGLPARVTATALEGLASRNLLDVRIVGAVLYKLDPASAELRAMVERTLEAARTRRSLVLKSILAGTSAARDFADAFQVTRKRRSDG